MRARFDADMDRFSNLETGQTAFADASLALELIAEAAGAATPQACELLDVGCGAGNYALKLLQTLPGMNVMLLDLSRPMIERAAERVRAATKANIRAWQGDIRKVEISPGSMDVITASAVSHHLRGDAEWRGVFEKLYRALRPGGSLWIADLVVHESPAVQEIMWRCYGEYLANAKGPDYRDQVFAYIEMEDTPRTLSFQTDLLHAVGFKSFEILHKNVCTATFGAIKSHARS